MTNYLKALTMELPALALVCGKSGGHHLEPDGLAAFDSRGSGDGQGAAGRGRPDSRAGRQDSVRQSRPFMI
jgi:hypothetical protein